MAKRMQNSKAVAGYVKGFPAPVQKLLKQLRQTVRKAAPRAKEKIAHGMPAYHHEGPLVYFGGFTKHVSFFPGTGTFRKFDAALNKYKGGKGTVQFPLDKALPRALITRLVKFRVAENERKALAKRRNQKARK